MRSIERVVWATNRTRVRWRALRISGLNEATSSISRITLRLAR
jgi:hypothetical protein